MPVIAFIVNIFYQHTFYITTRFENIFCGSQRKFCGSQQKFCGSQRKFCGSQRKFCGSQQKSCGSLQGSADIRMGAVSIPNISYKTVIRLSFGKNILPIPYKSLAQINTYQSNNLLFVQILSSHDSKTACYCHQL